MNKLFYIVLFAFLFTSCGEKTRKVQIQTEFGNMTVELFNSTPQHRDNFVKLVEEGFYDDLLFHRVIKNFMVQGGDPNSKGAPLTQNLGGGGPGYRIPAEIGELHYKGRLAAARTPDSVNPDRESSGSQFYIVDGNAVGDATLNSIETSNGLTYTEEQRAVYKQAGGTPFLDNQYSVFGQVTEGLDIIDMISETPTQTPDRPLKDVRMKIILLN